MRVLLCRLALLLGVWNLALGAAAVEPRLARDVVLTSNRPLVIAHRGNSSEFPENTLPAFASAALLKADLTELDYHTTADGIPIVLHDKTLDRTTNAKKLWGGEKLSVAKYKLAELKELDAGTWFNAKFAGTKLPTLDESLDVIQNGSMTLIEHKTGDAKTVVDLLRKKDLIDKVVVQSFDWKFLADCHQIEPKLLLGALGDKEITPARLEEIAKTGASVVGWNHKAISAKEINLLHEKGLKAWVYTVNDPERAQELLSDGIDGIITDRPAAIMKVRSGK
jgi:glycerophosphoryl diester phosphodiesterase